MYSGVIKEVFVGGYGTDIETYEIDAHACICVQSAWKTNGHVSLYI